MPSGNVTMLHSLLCQTIKDFFVSHLDYNSELKIDGTVCLIGDHKNAIVLNLDMLCCKDRTTGTTTENDSGQTSDYRDIALHHTLIKTDENLKDGIGSHAQQGEVLSAGTSSIQNSRLAKASASKETPCKVDDHLDNIVLVANEHGTFNCPFCLKTYSFKYSLKQHISLKHMGKNRDFKCRFCSQVFHYNSSLLSHMKRKHYDSISSKFECPICHERCINEPALKQHFTRKHADCSYVGPVQIACEENGSSLSSFVHADQTDSPLNGDVLDIKQEKVSDTENESLSQSMDTDNFCLNSTSVSLATDDSKVDPSVVSCSPLMYSLMKKTTNTRRKRRRPNQYIQDSLVGDEQITFSDNFSHKSSSGLDEIVNGKDDSQLTPLSLAFSSFDQYSGIATGCTGPAGVAFPSPEKLNISEDAESADATTSMQASSTVRRSGGRRNFVDHFEKVTDTETGKTNFKCRYCSKMFSSRSNLSQHLDSHEGVQPYTCQFCGECFTYRGSLYNHVNSKHKSTAEKEAVMTLSCKACTKHFRFPSELKRHHELHPDHCCID